MVYHPYVLPTNVHQNEMKYRKGSVVASWDSTRYILVPLFDREESENFYSQLPRFDNNPASAQENSIQNNSRTSGVDDFIHSLLKRLHKRSYASDEYMKIASVVVSVHSFLNGNGRKITDAYTDVFLTNDGSSNNLLFPTKLLTQSWELIHDQNISYDYWKQLCYSVLHNIRVIHQEHPLMKYSRESIPYMSSNELSKVLQILDLTTSSKPATANQSLSSIAVQQLVQEFCEKDRCSTAFALLLFETKSYLHSCLPNAQLELRCTDEEKEYCGTTNSTSTTVSLIALYDFESEDDIISISYVELGDCNTIEERDTVLHSRLGHSCTCLLCRYEMATVDHDDTANESCITSQITDALSHRELVRIGHYLMSQKKYHDARSIYHQALDAAKQGISSTDDATNHNTNLHTVADIYHALGAIELEVGTFLSAQRIWEQAYREYPDACRGHAGITLQIEKLKSYSYFDNQKLCLEVAIDPLISWESPASNCYVTKALIDSDTCTKIIKWTEELGTWTTKRHYAVPTYDVPIHTVPPLLDWFQNHFMNPIMQELLQQQFKSDRNGRFFVHDAFCVRYESNANTSNHLPIHVDESTHSIIVSLNDDFDGGGTYLYDYDIVLRPPIGSIISFRGDQIYHGGQAVTRGIRYIIAAFLYYDIDGTNVVPIKPKREGEELNTLLRDSKQQKIEFSFNFEC